MNTWLGSDLNGVLKCQTCGTIVRRVSDKMLEPWFMPLGIEIGIKVCESSLLGVLQPDVVCPGIVQRMATSVIDVIQREVLTQVRICDELLGFCERPVVETLLISDY